MSRGTCEQCGAWFSKDGLRGECRRRAPMPMALSRTAPAGMLHFAVHWIETDAADGCCDHVAKAEPAERLEVTETP